MHIAKVHRHQWNWRIHIEQYIGTNWYDAPSESHNIDANKSSAYSLLQIFLFEIWIVWYIVEKNGYFGN